MKLTNNLFLSPLTVTDLKKITGFQKEVLDVEVPRPKKLTAAELWKIHKQKRIFASRGILAWG